MSGPLVAVLSARRPLAPQQMNPFLGDAAADAVWYTAEDEAADYRAAGAARVIEAGTLNQARDLALDHARTQGRACLLLADDLRGLRRNPAAGNDGRCLIPEVAAALAAACEQTGATLAGLPPTGNPLFAGHKDGRPPWRRDVFIVGDCMYVPPTPLRFDHRLCIKADYDYTCQHLAHGGGTVRLTGYLANWQHYGNRGGVVSYRTPAVEDGDIAHLTGKWPGVFRPNPRRPHEVLMRWTGRRPCP